MKNNIKKEMLEKKLTSLIQAEMKEKLTEMIKGVDLFEPGDKVRFNKERFLAAKDFDSLNKDYVSFVLNSIDSNTVYTVVYDEEYTKDPVLLVCFEEDTRPVHLRWLNYVGYLDREGSIIESN